MVIDDTAPSRQISQVICVTGMAARAAAIASRGCATCTTPWPARSVRRTVARPGERRIPSLRLSLDQALPARRRDSTTDPSRDNSRSRRRPRRAGPPPRRSPHWPAASAAWSQDRLSRAARPILARFSRPARASAPPARGAPACAPACRPAVSGNRCWPALADMCMVVEALAQPRPRALPRRLHRVERLMDEDVLEDVAHCGDGCDLAAGKTLWPRARRPAARFSARLIQWQRRRHCALQNGCRRGGRAVKY